jgi:hypothetical protein
MKLCINCAFFRPMEGNSFDGICDHGEPAVNPVDGSPVMQLCGESRRRFEAGWCGPNAKYFQPKPINPPQNDKHDR